ncbi:MAG: fasciclin domain-containing protein [Synechococcaceae cyanobacterium SM2_3_60]|nr:fasciclin domain-containing protein [Synechococcaceae cyanobacterium SM2_3_60]
MSLAACNTETGTVTPPSRVTVMDAINSNPNIGRFAQVLRDTGLDRTLQNSTGSFTVFAPRDSAFAGVVLPAAIEPVRDLLSYHIVGRSLTTTQLQTLSGLQQPTLLPGRFVTFRQGSLGQVFINNAEVVRGNSAIVSNSVVHEIDRILQVQ